MPSSVANRSRDFRGIPAPERESDVLRQAVAELGTRLPTSWQMSTKEEVRGGSGIRVDAIVTLTTPGGQRIDLVIEAKRAINTRDVPSILEQVETYARALSTGNRTLPVLVARYLAPSTRDRIAATGAGYIDATGNIRLVTDAPGLFLSDRGADSDPWRGPGRPRGGLRGEPAARVVRALVDFAPPYSVPELAKRAGASTGATYRVIEFLDQEELAAREAYGPISSVRWRPLLMRWSEDYGLAQSNQTQTYLEPRGLAAVTERVRDAGDLKYVFTGSLAAERMAAYAPPRLAMVYADDPRTFAEAVGLRETQSGANVVVAAATYDVVYDRAGTVDGVRMAAASQVAVDLLSGPGRNPSEGAALLDWMEANESTWRR